MQNALSSCESSAAGPAPLGTAAPSLAGQCWHLGAELHPSPAPICTHLPSSPWKSAISLLQLWHESFHSEYSGCNAPCSRAKPRRAAVCSALATAPREVCCPGTAGLCQPPLCHSPTTLQLAERLSVKWLFLRVKFHSHTHTRLYQRGTAVSANGLTG